MACFYLSGHLIFCPYFFVISSLLRTCWVTIGKVGQDGQGGDVSGDEWITTDRE